MNGLRSEWIAKWLDDIGLPQYKDQFFEARIDGRMLNQLTVVSCLPHTWVSIVLRLGVWYILTNIDPAG